MVIAAMELEKLQMKLVKYTGKSLILETFSGQVFSWNQCVTHFIREIWALNNYPKSIPIEKVINNFDENVMELCSCVLGLCKWVDFMVCK